MKKVLFWIAVVSCLMFAGCAQSRSQVNVVIESRLPDSVGAPTVARIEWNAVGVR